jgi:hypothetical protein
MQSIESGRSLGPSHSNEQATASEAPRVREYRLCGLFAYFSGTPVAAAIIGVVAVLLFVVDFKVAMSEPIDESTLARVVREGGGPGLRVLAYLAIAVAIIVAVQLARAMVARTAPTKPAGASLCLQPVRAHAIESAAVELGQSKVATAGYK